MRLDALCRVWPTCDSSASNSTPLGEYSSACTWWPVGDIALGQRGACSFQLKAQNAADAGAVGVIVFNQGNTPARMGLVNATLGATNASGIPGFFATFDRGVEWVNTPGLILHMNANVFRGTAFTANLLAELPGDDDDDSPTGPVIVVGAHLDSVGAGAGINDNGSGSAGILEIALQLAEEEVETRNRIRFAWWSAEESGLVGSRFYVDNLSPEGLAEIALNLNFDMIGSPNFVRFIYEQC